MPTRKTNEPSREAGPEPLPPDRAWELKDYGLGPEPARYSPEWMEWIDSRAWIAGIQEAAEERKKKGRSE
jgi:hypothetical protein